MKVQCQSLPGSDFSVGQKNGIGCSNRCCVKPSRSHLYGRRTPTSRRPCRCSERCWHRAWLAQTRYRGDAARSTRARLRHGVRAAFVQNYDTRAEACAFPCDSLRRRPATLREAKLFVDCPQARKCAICQPDVKRRWDFRFPWIDTDQSAAMRMYDALTEATH